ncbi:MAG: CinA family protein [Clostridiales bacterium]|nr:CinA family protein [Clostridiales bacterium]
MKSRIKNRNRISFRFVPRPFECAVLVRYSNKTQKATIDEMQSGVTEALRDCTYAYEDVSLSERVAKLLMAQRKTLGIAESFTGGAIASSLVRVAGVSESFKESVVCYSNEVKSRRLHIAPETIEQNGAVSIETAYEMAANLLMDGNYDYVMATTGNAGPTSEKPNEVGVCYIAVGDRENVHIYRYQFTGNRDEVIAYGVQAALFRLYKLIIGEAEE